MAIPAYSELYSGILSLCSDGGTHSMREIREQLGRQCQLTNDEMEVLLPSGSQRLWDSRVGWCKTYLVKAGLLSQPSRGYIEITQRGRQVLAEGQSTVINDKYLLRFPEFRDFYTWGKGIDSSVPEHGVEVESSIYTDDHKQTPEELIESTFQQLRQQIEAEMLQRVMSCSPSFFEQLVVDLLLNMGYGGASRADAGFVSKQSGDEGIDGTIKEDKLGLDIIYIQAKRWTNVVGRPEIQRFVGALAGPRARKGVFITTSTFSREAYDYASSLDTKVVLIDGKRLAKLMFDHRLGCTAHSVYELRKIDNDYFEPSSVIS